MKYTGGKLTALIVVTFTAIFASYIFAIFNDTPANRYNSFKKDLSRIYHSSSSDWFRKFSVDDSESLLKKGFFAFYPEIISVLRKSNSQSSDISISESLASLLLFYADTQNPEDQRLASIKAFFHYLPGQLPSSKEFVDFIKILNRHFRHWKTGETAEAVYEASWQIANQYIHPIIKNNEDAIKDFEAFFKFFPEIEATIRKELAGEFLMPVQDIPPPEHREQTDENEC